MPPPRRSCYYYHQRPAGFLITEGCSAHHLSTIDLECITTHTGPEVLQTNAMFDDNFTFSSATRSPSLDSSNASSTREPSRSVSPCSPTGPFPPPRFSVTDLAAQFADQRLRRDARVYHDSCASYANSEDDAGWTIEPSVEEAEPSPVSPRSRTCPQRSTRAQSPPHRSHRQANARLLCSASHHRDIAALVSRMVQSNDQCSVNPPPDSSSATAANLEADEGYDSSEGSIGIETRRSSYAASRQRLEYRRSSDMKTTGACVSKNTRFRKGTGHSRVRSSGEAL